MRTLTTLALALTLLVSSASADNHGPKPSARPAGTPALHSPADDATTADADATIAAAKLATKRARAAKAAIRAKLAAAKATKALAKATKRAEKAAAKAHKTEAFETCLDEHVGQLDEDEAADICAEAE